MTLEVRSELPGCMDEGKGKLFQLVVSSFYVEERLANVVDR